MIELVSNHYIADLIEQLKFIVKNIQAHEEMRSYAIKNLHRNFLMFY